MFGLNLISGVLNLVGFSWNKVMAQIASGTLPDYLEEKDGSVQFKPGFGLEGIVLGMDVEGWQSVTHGTPQPLSTYACQRGYVQPPHTITAKRLAPLLSERLVEVVMDVLQGEDGILTKDGKLSYTVIGRNTSPSSPEDKVIKLKVSDTDRKDKFFKALKNVLKEKITALFESNYGPRSDISEKFTGTLVNVIEDIIRRAVGSKIMASDCFDAIGSRFVMTDRHLRDFMVVLETETDKEKKINFLDNCALECSKNIIAVASKDLVSDDGRLVLDDTVFNSIDTVEPDKREAGFLQAVSKYVDNKNNNSTLMPFHAMRSTFGMGKLFAELVLNSPRTQNFYGDISPGNATTISMDTNGKIYYYNADFVADFVNPNSCPRKFVAAQGLVRSGEEVTAPEPDPVGGENAARLADPYSAAVFWQQVVLGNSVDAVVMLTRHVEMGKNRAGQDVLKPKCGVYFPDKVGEELTFESGGLKVVVKCVEKEKHATYSYREFDVSVGDTTVRIPHYHYLNWGDMKATDVDEMIEFYEAVVKSGCKKPLVHCSAGVGRTGTFIALDMALHKLNTDHRLSAADVESIITTVRRARPKSIQTTAQFKFLRDVLIRFSERFLEDASAALKEYAVFQAASGAKAAYDAGADERDGLLVMETRDLSRDKIKCSELFDVVFDDASIRLLLGSFGISDKVEAHGVSLNFNNGESVQFSVADLGNADSVRYLKHTLEQREEAGRALVGAVRLVSREQKAAEEFTMFNDAAKKGATDVLRAGLGGPVDSTASGNIDLSGAGDLDGVFNTLGIDFKGVQVDGVEIFFKGQAFRVLAEDFGNAVVLNYVRSLLVGDGTVALVDPVQVTRLVSADQLRVEETAATLAAREGQLGQLAVVGDAWVYPQGNIAITKAACEGDFNDAAKFAVLVRSLGLPHLTINLGLPDGRLDEEGVLLSYISDKTPFFGFLVGNQKFLISDFRDTDKRTAFVAALRGEGVTVARLAMHTPRVMSHRFTDPEIQAISDSDPDRLGLEDIWKLLKLDQFNLRDSSGTPWDSLISGEARTASNGLNGRLLVDGASGDPVLSFQFVNGSGSDVTMPLNTHPSAGKGRLLERFRASIVFVKDNIIGTSNSEVTLHVKSERNQTLFTPVASVPPAGVQRNEPLSTPSDSAPRVSVPRELKLKGATGPVVVGSAQKLRILIWLLRKMLPNLDQKGLIRLAGDRNKRNMILFGNSSGKGFGTPYLRQDGLACDTLFEFAPNDVVDAIKGVIRGEDSPGTGLFSGDGVSKAVFEFVSSCKSTAGYDSAIFYGELTDLLMDLKVPDFEKVAFFELLQLFIDISKQKTCNNMTISNIGTSVGSSFFQLLKDTKDAPDVNDLLSSSKEGPALTFLLDSLLPHDGRLVTELNLREAPDINYGDFVSVLEAECDGGLGGDWEDALKRFADEGKIPRLSARDLVSISRFVDLGLFPKFFNQMVYPALVSELDTVYEAAGSGLVGVPQKDAEKAAIIDFFEERVGLDVLNHPKAALEFAAALVGVELPLALGKPKAQFFRGNSLLPRLAVYIRERGDDGAAVVTIEQALKQFGAGFKGSGMGTIAKKTAAVTDIKRGLGGSLSNVSAVRIIPKPDTVQGRALQKIWSDVIDALSFIGGSTVYGQFVSQIVQKMQGLVSDPAANPNDQTVLNLVQSFVFLRLIGPFKVPAPNFDAGEKWKSKDQPLLVALADLIPDLVTKMANVDIRTGLAELGIFPEELLRLFGGTYTVGDARSEGFSLIKPVEGSGSGSELRIPNYNVVPPGHFWASKKVKQKFEVDGEKRTVTTRELTSKPTGALETLLGRLQKVSGSGPDMKNKVAVLVFPHTPPNTLGTGESIRLSAAVVWVDGNGKVQIGDHKKDKNPYLQVQVDSSTVAAARVSKPDEALDLEELVVEALFEGPYQRGGKRVDAPLPVRTLKKVMDLNGESDYKQGVQNLVRVLPGYGLPITFNPKNGQYDVIPGSRDLFEDALRNAFSSSRLSESTTDSASGSASRRFHSTGEYLSAGFGTHVDDSSPELKFFPRQRSTSKV